MALRTFSTGRSVSPHWPILLPRRSFLDQPLCGKPRRPTILGTTSSRQRRWSAAVQLRYGVTSNLNHSRRALSLYNVSQPYQIPTKGLLSRLPASWVPYAELIRIDKPAGTLYLFLPCLYSTLLAAPLANPVPSPSVMLGTVCLFLIGSITMRGAGCTINDLWDRNLDPHVARTRLRPLARGVITPKQAVPFLGAQLMGGLGILSLFPHQCLYYGIPSLLLVCTYPLAKRVTNYPQLVLGLTFSWGALMGSPALGIDLLSNTPAAISAACLYGSCVAWTIIYDMIYAYQDIRDDAKAGIKSIALAQEANAKSFLTAIAGVQITLLVGAGAAIGAGPVFFVVSCGGAITTLEHMIRKVRLDSVEDCWAWFKNGAWMTGGVITVGLLGEYMSHYLELYKGSRWDRPSGRATMAQSPEVSSLTGS